MEISTEQMSQYGNSVRGHQIDVEIARDALRASGHSDFIVVCLDDAGDHYHVGVLAKTHAAAESSVKEDGHYVIAVWADTDEQ